MRIDRTLQILFCPRDLTRYSAYVKDSANFGKSQIDDRIDSKGESSVVHLSTGKCQLLDSQFRPIVREIWEQVAYAYLARSGNRNLYFSTGEQIDLAKNILPRRSILSFSTRQLDALSILHHDFVRLDCFRRHLVYRWEISMALTRQSRTELTDIFFQLKIKANKSRIEVKSPRGKNKLINSLAIFRCEEYENCTK